MKIKGSSNIRNFLLNEMDTTWKRLEKNYSNIKGEILFTLLLMINYYSQRAVTDDGNWVPDDYLRIPILLLTLDEFLVRGWNIIKIVTPAENQKYANIILEEYQFIGVLKNRMIESEAFNEEVLVLNKGEKISDVPIQLESAFEDWTGAIRRLDEDWMEYYHKETNISRKLTEVHRIEFSRKHGISPQQLYVFEKYLARQVQKDLSRDGIPFLHYNPADLLEKAYNVMNRVEPVDIVKVDAFLSELEYNHDRHWARSPFLKVQLNQSYLYALLLPSIYTTKVLSGAWLAATISGTKTEGMRNKDYGRHFEEYVREQLRKHYPELVVNNGNLRIKSTRFPEIQKCTNSSKIDIDVVAQSDTHVYLISCKAMDQNIGSKNLLTFFLSDYRTFYGSVEWDLMKAWEISDWVKCMSTSPSVLQDRRISGKTIVPLLVTPDQRPLGIESVKKWCVDMKIAYKLPEVKILRVSELKEYPFS